MTTYDQLIAMLDDLAWHLDFRSYVLYGAIFLLLYAATAALCVLK